MKVAFRRRWVRPVFSPAPKKSNWFLTIVYDADIDGGKWAKRWSEKTAIFFQIFKILNPFLFNLKKCETNNIYRICWCILSLMFINVNEKQKCNPKWRRKNINTDSKTVATKVSYVTKLGYKKGIRKISRNVNGKVVFSSNY